MRRLIKACVCACMCIYVEEEEVGREKCLQDGKCIFAKAPSLSFSYGSRESTVCAHVSMCVCSMELMGLLRKLQNGN